MGRIVMAGVGVVALLSSGVALADHERGYGRMACRSAIVGTYLTTIEDSAGAFASRSLITFHDDGTVAAVDAREASGLSGDAFSSQLGSYSCRGRHHAVATTVNFGFPPDQDIGRLGWTVRLLRDGTVAGDIALDLFTPLETCNPFEAEQTCNLEAQEDFSFTSVRVPSRSE